jgi:hypothetical protein
MVWGLAQQEQASKQLWIMYPYQASQPIGEIPPHAVMLSCLRWGAMRGSHQASMHRIIARRARPCASAAVGWRNTQPLMPVGGDGATQQRHAHCISPLPRPCECNAHAFHYAQGVSTLGLAPDPIGVHVPRGAQTHSPFTLAGGPWRPGVAVGCSGVAARPRRQGADGSATQQREEDSRSGRRQALMEEAAVMRRAEMTRLDAR